MSDEKIRPAIRAIVARMDEARRIREETKWDLAYEAYMQRLFTPPLPYSGRYVDSFHKTSEFAPLANPVRHASDDFISFHPKGGGTYLRLGVMTPLEVPRESPSGESQSFVIFDLPYDTITLERKTVDDPRVTIYAPPYRFVMHLGGFFTEDLWQHLLMREVRSAYEYGAFFEPNLSDMFLEREEPMHWGLTMNMLEEDHCTQFKKQWLELTEAKAN